MVKTNSSSDGRKTAAPRGQWAGRILAFALAVLLALGWVVWIKEKTWTRMEQLRAEFSAIESERFHLGLHARESIVRCNGALLRYQLSGSAGERETFRRATGELSERLAAIGPRLTSPEERRLLAAFKIAYARYLSETAELAEQPTRGIRRDTAAQLQEVIAEKSKDIVRLAEELVVAQRVAWTAFFTNSHGTLSSLQRLQWASVLALVALIALITTLIFRTFVAPLRVQLGESQAEIARQQQLASLGVLAAGVAHEIRNPLMAIKTRLFSLKKILPSDLRETEDLTIINSEINRLDRIVAATLQFARPAEPERSIVTINDLFTDVQRLLGATLSKRSIELRTDAADLSLLADRQQLEQVLINLVQNGADSIAGQGTVTLRARGGAATLAGSSQAVAVIEVSDTGKGIPSEVEGRIFDPFYSTKEGGTGLGLSIAARIIEKHGGTVQYSTQLNHGTTFTLVLPRPTS